MNAKIDGFQMDGITYIQDNANDAVVDRWAGCFMKEAGFFK